MAEQEQPFQTYLRQLGARLGPLTAEQRATIEAELWTHLEDTAAARGTDPTDAATQHSVIRALGPSRGLGRGLVQAYRRRGEDRMDMVGWRFWLLWVLASVAAWTLTAPAQLDSGPVLYIPASGAVMALLHGLIFQRMVARPGWWRWGLPSFCGPWLATTTLYAVLPWDSWSEGRWERTLFLSLVVLGIANGVTQWLVLRRYLRPGAVWLVVPFIALLASFIGMFWVNSTLIPMAQRRQLEMIGGWSGMFTISQAVFGLYYGVVSGVALLVLSRWRAMPRLA